MRCLSLAIAMLATCSFFAYTQEEKGDQKEKITLKIGDPAPALSPTKWVTGKEVKTFEPGKIYVVEFWATWCGPCVVMMPHLGDLQQRLGPKGLTIIGFSATDPGNTPEQIETFVKKRGDKLGYSIAYADNRETYEAFMNAAGQSGIPCSYVIGKDGKIVYIGHPLFLEDVLPKVLDGTWEAASGTAELKAADKLWDETYAAIGKPGKSSEEIEKQIEQWAAFHATWPHLATDPYMNTSRLNLYVAAKRFDDAAKLGKSIVTHAATRNDIAGYSSVAAALTSDGALGDKGLLTLGLSAAEQAMKLDGETLPALIRITKAYNAAGETAKVREFGAKAIVAAEKNLKGKNDPMGMLQLASAHHAAGDKEKAKATAEKAIASIDANNERMRSYIEDQAKKFGAEPPKEESEKIKEEKLPR